MEKIIISKHVEDDIFDLVRILYENDYFSYIENAQNYVDNLVDFINTLPKQIFKQNKNIKYGEYYSRYKHSRHTTWLIFFDKIGTTYFIKNITNNHHKNYITFLISDKSKK